MVGDGRGHGLDKVVELIESSFDDRVAQGLEAPHVEGNVVVHLERVLEDIRDARDHGARTIFLASPGYTLLGRPVDVVETSRGCTYDCSFCSIIEMRWQTFTCTPWCGAERSSRRAQRLED